MGRKSASAELGTEHGTESRTELARLDRRIACVRANFDFVTDDDLLESCIFYLRALESERRCLLRAEEVCGG